VQYAEVKRNISHEDYSGAQALLDSAGPTDAQGWALLAECSLRQKDYIGLADAARRSLAISGEYGSRLDYLLRQAFVEQLHAGIQAFDEGNDPESARLLNQLIVYGQTIRSYMSPEMVRASHEVVALAGAVSIRLKNYPNAREYLEGLRTQWKNNTALLERLALTYYQMGELGRCVATCESLLVKQPSDTTALQLRTQACQQLGKRDATVNAYRDALEKSPSSPILHRNLGTLLFELQDWKEARSHLEAASLSKPSDSLSLITMIAECLYNEADFQGALQRFKRAANRPGANAELFRAMGACYRSLGDRTLADAAFREAARKENRTRVEVTQDSTGSVSPSAEGAHPK